MHFQNDSSVNMLPLYFRNILIVIKLSTTYHHLAPSSPKTTWTTDDLFWWLSAYLAQFSFCFYDFHHFHEPSAVVVLARKFMLETRCFSSIFFFFLIIPPITENSGRANGLFDAGFSFKNIHDLQQGKGEIISLTSLYHFHPPHRHLDISWVITADS